MQDFEKLGVFYLGRRYDLAGRKAEDDLLLYDARDLTTHAVIVGMTGSGKTGLGLSLLEEAAIDSIPAIVIDPKGDLSNLLLTFPELRSSDFRPWVDEGEAARTGVTPDRLAESTAEQWKKGLADWGQDGARIKRFRDAADLAIYTPGSNAGLPLSVLRSFSAPDAAVLADAEALRDRISGMVSGLLALVDVNADPMKSREHILLSNIFERAWRAGRDLSLSDLIREIQKPPFDRLGVIDLESFFPEKSRFELAMSFNNLLASPGFGAWTEGAPLDVKSLLHTKEGRPRISILSIAHLSDSERMFFVSVLLHEVISWMRSQSGTASLRAILYMDEIFGYFPPSAMPPSKRPMLTLLKQARAFGLGVVLATQNPVDLDYKGLANAGTWFIGRMQTERDKLRVLDGLEGASAAAGRGFDRKQMDVTISGLGNRVFLMNDVHENQPVVFQSRHSLSYLRGPLTRDQIRTLMQSRKAEAGPPPPTTTTQPGAPASQAPQTHGANTERPVLPPEIPEFFIAPARPDSKVLYRPMLLASARLHFVSVKAGLDSWEPKALLFPLEGETEVEWDRATVLSEPPALEKQPVSLAAFASLPAVAARPASYEQWKRSFQSHLYQSTTLSMFRCASLKAVSKPGEHEGEFRVRLGQAAKELRDGDMDKLRRRYAPKLQALEDKLRRAEDRVVTEQAQLEQQTVDTAFNLGATLLGAFVGRKMLSVGNVTRARSAARSANRSMKERGDVAQAEAEVESVRARLTELGEAFDADAKKLESSIDPASLAIESIEVRPRKGDISIGVIALAWMPETEPG